MCLLISTAFAMFFAISVGLFTVLHALCQFHAAAGQGWGSEASDSVTCSAAAFAGNHLGFRVLF